MKGCVARNILHHIFYMEKNSWNVFCKKTAWKIFRKRRKRAWCDVNECMTRSIFRPSGFGAKIKITGVKRRFLLRSLAFAARQHRLAVILVDDGLGLRRLSYSSPFGRDPTVSQPRHRQGILARFPSDIILDFLIPEISILRADAREKLSFSLFSHVSRFAFPFSSPFPSHLRPTSFSSRNEIRDER